MLPPGRVHLELLEHLEGHPRPYGRIRHDPHRGRGGEADLADPARRERDVQHVVVDGRLAQAFAPHPAIPRAILGRELADHLRVTIVAPLADPGLQPHALELVGIDDERDRIAPPALHVGEEELALLLVQPRAHEVGIERAGVLVRQELETGIDRAAHFAHGLVGPELQRGLQLLESPVGEHQEELAERRLQ